MKKLKSEFIFEETFENNEVKILLEVDYANKTYSLFSYKNDKRLRSFSFEKIFNLKGLLTTLDVITLIKRASEFGAKELGITQTN